QHGGPPSGLLALGVERCEPREDMTVARFTCELLGPVPVGEVDLRARVVRPGRSVELVEAVLSAAGRDVARASAWRVRRADADPVPSRHPAPPPLPPPSNRPRRERPGLGSNYGLATEWRRGRGAAHELGPKAAWIRMRYPLVPDA
nr:thioesterase family protein [Micromonospora sp. DSM 115978]